jgi:hypothetical protein
MKKLLILALFLGIISTSFAQNGRWNNGNVYNNGRYGSSYDQRQSMSQQVAREYDYRIMQVRNDPYMRNAQKRREIRQLEKQRDQRLREIYNGNYNGNYNNNNGGYYNGSYNRRRDRDHDRDDD